MSLDSEPNQDLQGELVKEKARYERGKTLRSMLLGAILYVAASLHGDVLNPQTEEAEDIPEPPEQTTSESFEEKDSTGIVRLSDGSEIRAPKAGGEIYRVITYLPKDHAPDRLIVNFKWYHSLTPDQMEGNSEAKRWSDLNRTIQTGEIISRELSRMKGEGTISKVCVEALPTKANLERVEKFLQDRTLVRDYASSLLAPYLPGSDLAKAVGRREKLLGSKAPKLDKRELRELQTVIYPTFAKYYDEYKLIIGPAEALAAEKEIELCPADISIEERELMIGPGLLRKNPREWSAEDNIRAEDVSRVREEAAVSSIASQEKPAVGLVYGGLHDFKRAVDSWNIAHSGTEIGLVTVTPQATSPLFFSFIPGEFSSEQRAAVEWAFQLKPWQKKPLNKDELRRGGDRLRKNASRYSLTEFQTVSALVAVEVYNNNLKKLLVQPNVATPSRHESDPRSSKP